MTDKGRAVESAANRAKRRQRRRALAHRLGDVGLLRTALAFTALTNDFGASERNAIVDARRRGDVDGLDGAGASACAARSRPSSLAL